MLGGLVARDAARLTTVVSNVRLKSDDSP